MTLRHLSLLAQHDPGYQQGALWMHVGSVLTFIGLLGVGVVLLLAKPKPGQKSLSPTTTRVVAAAVLVLAFAAA
jgi:hypothetical protein